MEEKVNFRNSLLTVLPVAILNRIDDKIVGNIRLINISLKERYERTLNLVFSTITSSTPRIRQQRIPHLNILPTLIIDSRGLIVTKEIVKEHLKALKRGNLSSG